MARLSILKLLKYRSQITQAQLSDVFGVSLYLCTIPANKHRARDKVYADVCDTLDEPEDSHARLLPGQVPVCHRSMWWEPAYDLLQHFLNAGELEPRAAMCKTQRGIPFPRGRCSEITRQQDTAVSPAAF